MGDAGLVPGQGAGNVPEALRGALTASAWRWTLFDGRPYPPVRFSWTAWRRSLARSCSSEPRRGAISNHRRVKVPVQRVPLWPSDIS